MAWLHRPPKTPPLLSVSGKLPGARRFLFSFIVFVCIVLLGAVKSSGQDLGALARQEQLRKQSLPSHASHVYTNDDLVKPRILVPEDRPEARHEPPPEVHPEVAPEANLDVAPDVPTEVHPDFQATPPQSVSAPVESSAEPIQDSAHVPLGDIARQYRERKLARQEQSLREVHPIQSTHIYNNEDLVRPEILTPEDRVLFEARQNITVPGVDKRAPELLAQDPALPEPPLGDIARAYHQREALPETHEPEPSRFRFSWNTISLASAVPRERPTSQPSKPPKLGRVLHPSERRRRDQQSAESRKPASELVTVKRGDSLWKLARLYLGQGSRWRALLKANPWINNPDYLNVGAQIRI